MKDAWPVLTADELAGLRALQQQAKAPAPEPAPAKPLAPAKQTPPARPAKTPGRSGRKPRPVVAEFPSVIALAELLDVHPNRIRDAVDWSKPINGVSVAYKDGGGVNSGRWRQKPHRCRNGCNAKP